MTISPYTDSDLSQVISLWNASLPLDAMTPGMFESRILLDANFSPDTFLLGKDGSSVVGFVLGFQARRQDLGDADPDGTRAWVLGLGVGSGRKLDVEGNALLRELEKRFVQNGKKECLISTYPPAYITPGVDIRANKPLLDFYLSNGYVQVKEALSMDAPIALFEVSPAVQKKQQELLRLGIDVRTFRHSDLLAFLDFLEGSMPTDWVRVERRNLQLMVTGAFSPDQITVVVHGGRIIGYCQFEGSHFGPFGVAEEHQGKGIGTVLLARTLERMRHMGYHNAWVMWTDDVAAKVYGKFGFTETRRFAILRKELGV